MATWLRCAIVRAHLHGVRAQQLRAHDRQPGLVPRPVQRRPVLGRHRDVPGTVHQQARPAAEEVHQNRRLVRSMRTGWESQWEYESRGNPMGMEQKLNNKLWEFEWDWETT